MSLYLKYEIYSVMLQMQKSSDLDLEHYLLVSIGPLFSYGQFSTYFFDMHFLDKKENDTSVTVLDFCHGTRKNFVRIACFSWSFLDMSGKEAFLNHLETACKITWKPKTSV